MRTGNSWSAWPITVHVATKKFCSLPLAFVSGPGAHARGEVSNGTPTLRHNWQSNRGPGQSQQRLSTHSQKHHQSLLRTEVRRLELFDRGNSAGARGQRTGGAAKDPPALEQRRRGDVLC